MAQAPWEWAEGLWGDPPALSPAVQVPHWAGSLAGLGRRWAPWQSRHGLGGAAWVPALRREPASVPGSPCPCCSPGGRSAKPSSAPSSSGPAGDATLKCPIPPCLTKEVRPFLGSMCVRGVDV